MAVSLGPPSRFTKWPKACDLRGGWPGALSNCDQVPNPDRAFYVPTFLPDVPDSTGNWLRAWYDGVKSVLEGGTNDTGVEAIIADEPPGIRNLHESVVVANVTHTFGVLEQRDPFFKRLAKTYHRMEHDDGTFLELVSAEFRPWFVLQPESFCRVWPQYPADPLDFLATAKLIVPRFGGFGGLPPAVTKTTNDPILDAIDWWDPTTGTVAACGSGSQ